MSSVLKSLSRHGRATYESDDSIDLEKQHLSAWVNVLDDGINANIIVVHSKCIFDQKSLDENPDVELVVTTTSGYDHIDLDACQRAGVRIARLPLVRRDAVVESTFAMLFSALRQLPFFRNAAVAGQWMRSQLPLIAPSILRGKRVGVVGCGVIGRQMIHALSVFGCDVIAVDPNGVPSIVESGTMADMANCDVLSLHCNLNQGNRGMISSAFLQSVKPNMILINTARGRLVDVDAALTALDDGRLSALCLDVFPIEPYSQLINSRGRKGLYLTPHSAGYYPEIDRKISTDLVETVSKFVEGKSLPHEIQL